jgi:hypothetical protein
VAVAQLFSRRSRRGTFRAVRFRNGPDLSAGRGRRSLAESLGSFAPNTVIVGIDTDRELLLAHQLKPTGGPEAIDVLELG